MTIFWHFRSCHWQENTPDTSTQQQHPPWWNESPHYSQLHHSLRRILYVYPASHTM